jgi:hypothetical protein
VCAADTGQHFGLTQREFSAVLEDADDSAAGRKVFLVQFGWLPIPLIMTQHQARPVR